MMSAITLSGDGTSHRHIQYDSRHYICNTGTSHELRTLGVGTAPNHTSETQLDGWKTSTSFLYEIYNSSPRGQISPEDARTFATKISGVMSDHAEDQKKLVRLIGEWKRRNDRTLRGERALKFLTLAELLPILVEETNTAMEKIGGASEWANLTPEGRTEHNRTITDSLISRIGQEALDSLPEDERALAELYVHGGCCMHKELNAMKGGNTRMSQFWARNDLQGPVLLMNRDNAAAAAAGTSQAQQRAVDKSCGGGAKATELSGALLRHKDDKKGQQDLFRYFLEAFGLGKLLTFPDTSNTRFGSIGDGSSFLVMYLPIVSHYLEHIRDKKASGQWNHLEANVHIALKDIPTLTELCVLSIYSQTVGHPYMRAVRSPTRPNHLELGPLHTEVRKHIQQIIDNPDLVLGPDASPETGVLNNEEWDQPAAFEAIHRLMPILPHLRGALTEFFAGALDTWQNFVVEFAPGGIIDQLTDVLKGHAFMDATNDVNEGQLGTVRVALRHSPNMSIWQFNARQTYKTNDVRGYIKQLSNADRQFLRSKYREIDASGRERKRRREIADADHAATVVNRAHRAAVRVKKDADLSKLLELTVLLNGDTVQAASLTVTQIKDQIRWHRRFVDTAAKGEKKMTQAKDLPNRKADQFRELVDAIKRYEGSPELQARAQDEMARAREQVLGRESRAEREDVAMEVESDWEE